MAAASKFSANERLVRKRLAARLRQRRCRERRREAALAVKVDALGGGGATPSDEGAPRRDVQGTVEAGPSTSAVGNHPSNDFPSRSGGAIYQTTVASGQQSIVANKPSLHESGATSSRSNYGPVPVSPGNSTAEAEAVVKAPNTNKPLASQEMAAIDAMLALRSNDASSADEAEEESGSTSSLSSKDGRSSHASVPKDSRMKVPETVYHHHYRAVPPPPTHHGYYHQHHPHHVVAPPPQPWMPHYYPHPMPSYYPAMPPQASYYWTRPANGKPQSSSSSAVASRVRA